MDRRTLLSGLTILPLTAGKGIDASFRRQMSDAMAVAPVLAAVIGRIEKGALAWVEAIGDCTGDTVFQAASLTKQVTAYVAFALRDQGKLDFAAPLVRYVDDITDERSRRVTLRHVLSHSSGFPNWRNEVGQGLVSAFEPGEKWQYSGEGYVYLQRIIEHITGKSFWSTAEEIVFRPLKMQSTAMCWVPELAARFAEPHRRRGEPVAKWMRREKTCRTSRRSWGKMSGSCGMRTRSHRPGSQVDGRCRTGCSRTPRLAW
ncbi:MAG: beta-lactamase family protein [Acidobacteria bacterium]|nr:beta-lactamase family protein [Acidobacteriota bacterium]